MRRHPSRRTPAPEAAGIGARIRRLRSEAGLSQDSLGSPYYTRAYVSAIELERIQPSLKALTHLALRLGVGVAQLAEPPQMRLDSLVAANQALEIVAQARQQAKASERHVLLAAEFALRSTARTLAERRRTK